MGSAEKNLVIVKAVLAGRSLAEVACQYGVSKVWIYKLFHRYREHGWPGLRGHAHGAPTTPLTRPRLSWWLVSCNCVTVSPAKDSMLALPLFALTCCSSSPPAPNQAGKTPKTLTITRDIR